MTTSEEMVSPEYSVIRRQRTENEQFLDKVADLLQEYKGRHEGAEKDPFTELDLLGNEIMNLSTTGSSTPGAVLPSERVAQQLLYVAAQCGRAWIALQAGSKTV